MPPFIVALVAYDADEVPAFVHARLKDAGVRFLVGQFTQADEAVSFAADADVVWIFGGPRILTADVLSRLPKCRAVLRSGSGTDNVAVDAATSQGIVVANTPQATVNPVAEQTIGLLFAVARLIAFGACKARAGEWDRRLPRTHVSGSTLGLVGFGRIGQRVAEMAAGFDMKILANDPLVSDDLMTRRGVTATTFEDLISQSDFVSLHCPLTDATFHLIDEAALKKMKPTAVLLNLSRGSVVDEAALTRALQEDWIGGAGLDVLEQEPPDPNNPILKLDNTVITPHVGGSSDTFPKSFWDDSVATLIEMSKNRMPLWYVNPTVKPRWEPAG